MIDSAWLSTRNWILGLPTDSFDTKKDSWGNKQLHYAAGYYLLVSAEDLTAKADLAMKPAFHHTIRETNGQWWVVISDTLQSIVKSAHVSMVKSGEKDTVFAYDSSCLCYPVPIQKKDRWILIEAGGEFQYVHVPTPYKKKGFNWKFWKRRNKTYSDGGGSYNYSYRRGFGRWRWMRTITGLFIPKYTLMQANPGYIVTNQPEYKHYDTLKSKAFIVKRKGKPLKKDIYVRIYSAQDGYKPIFNQKIEPVSPGAYTFDFAIPDSFKIDVDYTLSFCNKKGAAYKNINFKVADYELKKVTYSWENKQTEYYRGNKIIFYAKAVDANNLPLPDATVRLKLNIQRVDKTYDSLMVLADTVFRSWLDTTINCSPDGLTAIELPAHLVPNADIYVYGRMEFMNADNQPGTATHGFLLLANSKRYYLVPDSNGLRTGYLVQGNDSVGMKAKWRVNYSATNKKEKTITLPYYHDWEPGALWYQLLDTNGVELLRHNMPTSIPKPPKFFATKTYDSVFITLDNPLGVEVAWRITYDKKIIYKGAGYQMEYNTKLKGDKPVSIIYSYTWAGQFFTFETITWVKEKQLTVHINQPGTAFPGQAVPVEITVTDYQNRAVKNVNLTAYSVNAEFDNVTPPAMPYYGKSYGGTLRQITLQNVRNWVRYTTYTYPITGQMFSLMQLYKHPYYRLMYNPTAIGVEYDSLSKGKTELNVNVRNKGMLKGYYALWIDDTLRYYNQNSRAPHSFSVAPGKHTVKVRAYEGMYTLDSVDCLPGMKTVVGLNGDSVYNNKNIQWTELKNTLSVEVEAYNPRNKHILYIGYKNNNASISANYLRQGDRKYAIAHFGQTYYYNSTTYTGVGPFDEGEIELIIPNDTVIRFYFNPKYQYQFDGISVFPSMENYAPTQTPIFDNRYHFSDTAIEIPYPLPPPPADTARSPKTVNYIKNYQTNNPFRHPGIRYYSHYNGDAKISQINLYADDIRNLSQVWLMHKDSLEYSTIYSQQGGNINLRNLAIIPGTYDILLVTDTNTFKLIRNYTIKAHHYYYYKPLLDGFMPYDSAILWPYIAQVKVLNRGPVPDFYNRPVRVQVDVDKEPVTNTEKLIGEFTINGQFVQNALVILEDYKGVYVAAGLTNSYGVYQIPVLPGTYKIKVYTTAWDMFVVEKLTVGARQHTLANIAVKNYTNQIAVESYEFMRPRSPEPITNAPRGQNNAVSGNCSGNCGEIRGVVIDADTKEPLIGATVLINGTTIGAITDEDGKYAFKNLLPGKYQLMYSYISYQTKLITEIEVKTDRITFVDAKLMENVSNMDEVVVLTEKARPPGVKGDELYRQKDEYYYTSPKTYTVEEVENMPMRMINQKSMSQISDGVPSFRGARTSGTAYYVDGVRITGGSKDIETQLVNREDESARMLQMVGDTTSMRTRKLFRDYGYWVPNLVTNKKGKAGFTVQLPDNQTRWLTFVPAMDGKKHSGLGISSIKAYKPLTANLGIPRFMVVGDRLEITGKSVNYTADSVVVDALLKANDSNLYNQPVGFRFYTVAQGMYRPSKVGIDSFTFSIKNATGYTDGEQRAVPILANGLLISDGETKILEGGVNITLSPNDGYTNRQLLLSNKRLDMLQAEIDKLRDYEYGCVEQTASKLKALLLEKQFAQTLQKEFKDEKLIKTCIKKLEKMQNDDGSCGWWGKGDADIFMTTYAADALNDAVKAGYQTSALLKGARYLYEAYNTMPPGQKVSALIVLAKLRYGDVSFKISQIEKFNLNLSQYYSVMKAKQELGLPVNIDTLLKTIRFINNKEAAWGEKVFSIQVNELQTSALAYSILRNKGGYDTLLRKVRNYFLAQPPSARNTIESATMLQTFMQDIATEDALNSEIIADVQIDGTAAKLPLKMKIADQQKVVLDKKGSDVYYLYAWQQFVADPMAQNSLFRITTTLTQEGKTGDEVVAGKAVAMAVNFVVETEKEYVMLEVPIPAGFSYITKTRGYNGYEVHREHFDDKVSIFFAKIPRGRYDFTIELLPKFKGEVTLLPAHAEEMYFPMNRGNNVKRVVTVR